MATTRFKTTIDSIKGGVKSFNTEKAIQNIEGWEKYLAKHDQSGIKVVVQDLGKLKKLLQAKEIDSEAVKKLISKMGKDTVKVAGEGQNAEAKHIRELGETLSQATDESVTAREEDEDADEIDSNQQDEDDDEEEDFEDDEDIEEELDDEEESDDEDQDLGEPDEADEEAAETPKKAAKKTPSKTAKKPSGKK